MEGFYVCSECGHRFDEKGFLIDHTKEEHGED